MVGWGDLHLSLLSMKRPSRIHFGGEHYRELLSSLTPLSEYC